MQGERDPAFADTLRHLRERAGLSQAGMAQRCGLHHSTISRLESRNRWPSRALIEAIVANLPCSLEEEDWLLVSAGYAAPGSTRRHPLVIRLELTLGDSSLPGAYKTMVEDVVFNLIAGSSVFLPGGE